MGAELHCRLFGTLQVLGTLIVMVFHAHTESHAPARAHGHRHVPRRIHRIISRRHPPLDPEQLDLVTKHRLTTGQRDRPKPVTLRKSIIPQSTFFSDEDFEQVWLRLQGGGPVEETDEKTRRGGMPQIIPPQPSNNARGRIRRTQTQHDGLLQSQTQPCNRHHRQDRSHPHHTHLIQDDNSQSVAPSSFRKQDSLPVIALGKQELQRKQCRKHHSTSASPSGGNNSSLSRAASLIRAVINQAMLWKSRAQHDSADRGNRKHRDR